MDRSLIETYATGGEKLALAIRGLTRDDMTCFPIPATWSILQVVVHLMDSDLIGSDRMKRIIAEDNPTLIGYNETRFIERLFPHDQDPEVCVRILDLNRKEFAKILRKQPDDAFKRTGTHNEVGVVSLAQMIEKYIKHLEHHMKFIHDKRAKMGKEMW
jgi:hypothetical protein